MIQVWNEDMSHNRPSKSVNRRCGCFPPIYCLIITGPTGPVGPTGPTGAVGATGTTGTTGTTETVLPFGGMNSQNAAIYNLATSVVPACFAFSMLSNRVTHIAAPCSLQVEAAGVYKVQYKLDLTPDFTGGPIYLNVFIQVNGSTFATEQHLLTSGIENTPHVITYVSLAADDMVSIALSASSAAVMVLLPANNAYLAVQMLGA